MTTGFLNGILSNKFLPYLLTVLVWAGIYLPGLGVFELSFGESRRVYPALTMMETGEWAVPVLEGEKYFKKPPMINWMIAGAFIATGQKSELTARLPSALSILVFISILMLMDSGFLDLRTRFISSLIFLSSAGIIGKGLICEIEAPYICFTGVAMISWLNLYSARAGNFKLWCIPGILLGICLLIKGPIALLFFYSMVFGVLYYEKRFKDTVFSWGHLVGIAIMLAMFVSWAVQAWPTDGGGAVVVSGDGENVTGTWINEMLLQFKTGRIGIGLWFVRVGGSIANFLPWIVFIPLFFKSGKLIRDEKSLRIFKGCGVSILITFFIVNSMPGTKARYTMPLIPLATVLIGLLLSKIETEGGIVKIWGKITLSLSALVVLACGILFSSVLIMKFAGAKIESLFSKSKDFVTVLNGLAQVDFTHAFLIFAIFASAAFIFYQIFNHRREILSSSVSLVFIFSVLLVILMLNYPMFQPVVRNFEKFRPVAKIINEFIPSGETLMVYKIDCEPFFFYMKNPWTKVKTFPKDFTGYLVCPEEKFEDMFNRKRIKREDSFRINKTQYGIYEL